MPRISGVYTQPFDDVITETTISSSVYNGTINDIETDLNTPRPILAGGTGATTSSAARANLSAEVRNAQVTNYNSHVFESGSFWSLIAATGAPTAVDFFVGTAILLQGNQDTIVLQARNFSDGRLWYRRKTGGVWNAWAADQVGNYVDATGDTMSGALIVTPKGSVFGSPAGAIAPAAPAVTDANILLYNGGAANWAGIGADPNGAMWFRTGTSGAPAPALYIDTAQNLHVTDGLIFLDPTNPPGLNNAVSKQYVDETTRTVTDIINVLVARIEELERKIT